MTALRDLRRALMLNNGLFALLLSEPSLHNLP
jgi:hypothetical protein